MDIQTFPILAFNPSDTNFNDLSKNGTGFIVDNSGLFYTAGHNFYKKERGRDPEKLKCYALINNALQPIQEIHLEYEPNADDTNKDFAYGKVLNFNNLAYTKTIQCNQPTALGYTCRVLNFDKIESASWKNKLFHLYKVPISIGTNSKSISNGYDITFDNSLFYTVDSGITLEGLSGGPILHNDEILGVLVSDCFVTKEYIDNTLKSYK